jgi:hypothetical protein
VAIRQVWWTSLKAGLEPDKSGATTAQVQWGSLEASGNTSGSRSHTGLVRCHHLSSLESGPDSLEAGGFTRHVWGNLEIGFLDG